MTFEFIPYFGSIYYDNFIYFGNIVAFCSALYFVALFLLLLHSAIIYDTSCGNFLINDTLSMSI